MRKIGRIIYSYRKIKGLSQEELADLMGVSPAAVSKWERDLSIPDVEILCKLADYFEVTVDELLGRTQDDSVEVKLDDQTDADRFCVATEILECCRIARNTGLLAVEERVKKKEESIYDFLKFAVSFLMEAVFQNKIPLGDAKDLLAQYAEGEKDQRTAKMISEMIPLIFSGEDEDFVRAAAGTSAKVRARLFCNLSDRMVWMLGERLVNFAGEPKEVKEAQRKMLELLGE